MYLGTIVDWQILPSEGGYGADTGMDPSPRRPTETHRKDHCFYSGMRKGLLREKVLHRRPTEVESNDNVT